MKHIDPFENYFQEQFEDFEASPEVNSWQQIHDRLHGKRRRVFYWWWMAAAASLLLGGAMLWFWNRTPLTNDTVAQGCTEKNTVASQEPNISTIPNATTHQKQLVDNQPTTNNSIHQPITSNTMQYPSFLKSSTKKMENKHPFEIAAIPNETIVFKEVPNQSLKNTVAETATQVNSYFAPESLPILTAKELLLEQKEQNVNISYIPNNKGITQPVKEKRHYWTLTPTIGTMLNYRNINPNANDDKLLSKIQNPATFSTKRIGFDAALNASYSIRKNIQWVNAISYQRTPFDVTYDIQQPEITQIQALVNNNGKSLNVNSIDYASKQETLHQAWQMLGLETGISYIFNKKNKNSLSVSVGSGFWLGKKLDGIPFYGTLSGSYHFTKSVAVQPFFTYHFNAYQLDNQLFSVQPYQAGLRLNLFSMVLKP